MIVAVHSAYNAATIDSALGAPEYSYWFVRRAFWPVLESFGIVVPVTDPKREVDTIRASAAQRGHDTVYLPFDPPNQVDLNLDCRTIPVFAWEFDTIPAEVWEDEPRHDWRRVLAATGSAITHSRFSVDAVRRAMGQDYPVWCIPAPVYDAHARFAADARPYQPPTDIAISGIAIDSAQLDAAVFSTQRGFTEGMDSLRALAQHLAQPGRPPQTLRLSGVIYTTVFNPLDGRKNFSDLLGAFVWAFRDVEDATLILKVTHFDPVRGLYPALADIAKLGRFRCRVLLVHGMLPDAEYGALIGLTSYTVNASSNEGQCLPLMEFMSAGRPAVTPAHTAMLDYVNTGNAFVVSSSVRPYPWPHDPRQAIRAYRHAVSFADLVRAYRASYAVARADPARYAAMSKAATNTLQGFCSVAVAKQRLSEVLGVAPQQPVPAPTNTLEEQS